MLILRSSGSLYFSKGNFNLERVVGQVLRALHCADLRRENSMEWPALAEIFPIARRYNSASSGPGAVLTLQVNQPYTAFFFRHNRLASPNSGQLLFLGFNLEMWILIEKPARSASSVAVPGTTTRVTAVPRTVTGTTPTTATITWASVVPELKTGLDDPDLNRSGSRPFGSEWRNQMAPGVLVARGGCPAKAHRWAALSIVHHRNG